MERLRRLANKLSRNQFRDGVWDKSFNRELIDEGVPFFSENTGKIEVSNRFAIAFLSLERWASPLSMTPLNSRLVESDPADELHLPSFPCTRHNHG